MIKAKATMNGRPVLVLGLTEENVKRLKDEDHILIHGQDMNEPNDILIAYGATDKDVVKILSKQFDFAGARTNIIGSPTRAQMRMDERDKPT